MNTDSFDKEWREGHATITKANLRRFQERREVTYFTVEGAGDFPFDMLRFDECWPASGEDTGKMAAGRWSDAPELMRRRQVRMGAARKGAPAPTVKRWESFGWRVVEED